MARSSRKKTAPGIRVIGPKGGLRRAGLRFGPGETDIPLDRLSEEQLAAIRDEPRLVVTDIEIPLEGEVEPVPDGG